MSWQVAPTIMRCDDDQKASQKPQRTSCCCSCAFLFTSHGVGSFALAHVRLFSGGPTAILSTPGPLALYYTTAQNVSFSPSITYFLHETKCAVVCNPLMADKNSNKIPLRINKIFLFFFPFQLLFSYYLSTI